MLMGIFYICLSVSALPMVRAADTDYMNKSITDHFSESRYHTNVAYKTATKEFIFNEFKRFGLEAEYHEFTDSYSPGTTFVTVIGVLKGERFGKVEDKIVGIGAHYDTVQNTKGVDDNGAGVAAMLDVARQLTEMNKRGTKRQNTILFASFDLEEYGPLAGSKNFIASWMDPWLATNYGEAAPNIVPNGVIILDTMMEYNTSEQSQKLPVPAGNFQSLFPVAFASVASDKFRGDFLALIYRKTADAHLASTLKAAWTGAGRDQFEMESFPLPFESSKNLTGPERSAFGDFLRSDHKNFWDRNIPAIFITDSANLRGDMEQCYHKPCDDLQTMLTDDNINFLGKTADAVTKAMHVLSDSHTSGTNMKIPHLSTILAMLSIVYMVMV